MSGCYNIDVFLHRLRVIIGKGSRKLPLAIQLILTCIWTQNDFICRFQLCLNIQFQETIVWNYCDISTTVKLEGKMVTGFLFTRGVAGPWRLCNVHLDFV